MESFNLFKAEDELNRSVTFKSLNENVATVSADGNIKAIKLGITKVIGTDELSGKIVTIDVNVLEDGAIATPKIASGKNHTIALKSDGTVWTWGYNAYGQLGIGTTTSMYVPTKVNIDNVIDISAGDHFSMALKADGTLWAWGYNDYGQLGQNNTVQSTVPMQVMGVNGIGYLQNVTKITHMQRISFC